MKFKVNRERRTRPSSLSYQSYAPTFAGTEHITFTRAADRKIKRIVESASKLSRLQRQELMIMLLARKGAPRTVVEVRIPDQEVSSSHVCSFGNSILRIADEAMEHNLIIVGSFHLHPFAQSAFFSGTDYQLLGRLMDETGVACAVIEKSAVCGDISAQLDANSTLQVDGKEWKASVPLPAEISIASAMISRLEIKTLAFACVNALYPHTEGYYSVGVSRTYCEVCHQHQDRCVRVQICVEAHPTEELLWEEDEATLIQDIEKTIRVAHSFYDYDRPEQRFRGRVRDSDADFHYPVHQWDQGNLTPVEALSERRRIMLDFLAFVESRRVPDTAALKRTVADFLIEGEEPHHD